MLGRTRISTLCARLVIGLTVSAIVLAATVPVQADDPPSAGAVGKAWRQVASDLLDEIKVAKDATAAADIERRIWESWMHSGDSETDGLLGQGIMLMQTGQFDSALAIFDSIVARRPDFAEGWNKRATLLYIMGDLDRSLEDIDKVLALEPRHFGALAGIGLIRIAKGDKAGALAAYRKVLEVHPFSRGALESVETLSKELEGDPT